MRTDEIWRARRLASQLRRLTQVRRYALVTPPGLNYPILEEQTVQQVNYTSGLVMAGCHNGRKTVTAPRGARPPLWALGLPQRA